MMNALDFWRSRNSLDRLLADDAFHPSYELTEEKDQYIAKLEVPGIPKNAIKIEVHDNMLTVSGEKKEEHKASGKRRYSECSYGSFLRSFTLPSAVDAEKVRAEYKDGILTIALAKAPGATGARQIAIQ